MNLRQFCWMSLKDEFRARFGRELEWGTYLTFGLLYGGAILQAMGEGMIVKVYGLGSLRPKWVKNIRFDEGSVAIRDERGMQVKKDKKELCGLDQETYLCANNQPENKSRFLVKRYVTGSKHKD